MKTTWTKGLNEQQKEEITSSFRSAGRLRERMREIVVEKLRENSKTRVSKSSFENPSWPYFQAESNGYERAMDEILSLLESGVEISK